MSGQAPPVIGITGGIGSGKSRVAGILRELGCCVSDADTLAKAALDETSIRETLVSWWGEEILDEDGRVDRSAVADRVFEDQDELDRLESLVHPQVEALRKAAFEGAGDDVVAFVIDAPLLLEKGLESHCDAVIFVDTPREIRLARLAESRGWNEAEMQRREDMQMPLDEKRNRADHVVQNHGRVEDLREQVESVLRALGRL